MLPIHQQKQQVVEFFFLFPPANKIWLVPILQMDQFLNAEPGKMPGLILFKSNTMEKVTECCQDAALDSWRLTLHCPARPRCWPWWWWRRHTWTTGPCAAWWKWCSGRSLVFPGGWLQQKGCIWLRQQVGKVSYQQLRNRKLINGMGIFFFFFFKESELRLIWIWNSLSMGKLSCSLPLNELTYCRCWRAPQSAGTGRSSCSLYWNAQRNMISYSGNS